MPNIEKLKPAWFDHRTDIPHWIAKGIGQVAANKATPRLFPVPSPVPGCPA
jgi:hypothetical protein